MTKLGHSKPICFFTCISQYTQALEQYVEITNPDKETDPSSFV